MIKGTKVKFMCEKGALTGAIKGIAQGGARYLIESNGMDYLIPGNYIVGIYE